MSEEKNPTTDENPIEETLEQTSNEAISEVLKEEVVASTEKVEVVEEVAAITEKAEVVDEVVVATEKEEVVEEVVTSTEKAKEIQAEIPVESKDTKEEVQTESTEEEVEEDKGPHDEFDWERGNKHKLPYDQNEIDTYLKEYDATFSPIEDGQIVSGIVTDIRDGDVVLDISFKSDGLVSISEFRDTPDMAVGDAVDVYVEHREDDRGQLVLSRKKAKVLKAWESLVDSYKNGTIVKGLVISKTKGGLIVNCGGLETFLPGSQIDVKPIIDYDSYVGKTMEFKVVKINETIKNAVVSHKALVESDLAEQREAIISGLEQGQVLESVVKNITDFGAFMDLGGVDGLLYITDISWGRISHPSDVLELNQKLNVVVLDFDENKRRISLGLKQLQPHPWDVLAEDIKEGSVVKGKIVNIEDYGAFIEITPGVEGLIHVSEVTWSNHPVNARNYFTLNEECDAQVVTIDRENRKMSLSIKSLTKDPWSDLDEKFPVNSQHKGIVKNLTPYGVFVELEEGVGGMVHISDLSWIKRYSHPSEFTKVGEEIDVVILDIDKESRKMSLGHKQLEENPWDTFENVFPVGSYHEITVIRKEERGAIVQLPYGLEAFAPNNHIKKEDGTSAEVDESLTVKVIEFNRDDKRILVSHLRYLQDIKRDADDSVRTEKRAEKTKLRKNIKSQQSRIEKTTLGEMDVFESLKAQFNEAQMAKAPAPKKEEPAVSDKKEEDKPSEKVAKKTTKKADKGDDLKKIEGIGPKISELLVAAGIVSFEDLSKSNADAIREILLEAGSRYKMFDPTTWPGQAKIAADGDWDKLKKWQDELKGGKV